MSYKRDCLLCCEAELHYLGIIGGDDYGMVPQYIADHVKICSYCQRQVAGLKKHLQGVADAETSQAEHFTEFQVHAMAQHLAYLGKKVSCNTVKPFLPKLLEQKFEIGVPTPITMHLESCESCRKDLTTIKSLGLTSEHLVKLSELFSCRFEVGCKSWSDTPESIRSYVNLDFKAIEPSVIRHLCHCDICQILIYKVRAKRLKAMDQKQQKTPLCESVSFSNVFDYCFPCEMVGDKNGGAEFKESIIEHIRQCPECLSKVQRMHEEIFAIKQRPESGVVTIYHLDDSEKFISTSESENVDILQIDAETDCQSESEKSRNIKPNFFRRGLNYLPRAAAAAVLVFAVMLFCQSIPNAKASSLQQIYKAIKGASNVYIQMFTAKSANPTQEKLISRTRGIYAVRYGNDSSLLDLQRQTKITAGLNNSEPKEVSLTGAETIACKRKINGTLGLLPFEDISRMPQNAVWKQLSDTDLLSGEYTGAGYKVYELSWSDETWQGEKKDFKCHVFIESEKNRPLKIEFYERMAESGEYELQTVKKVRYLSDDSMEDYLKAFFR